jgi:ubiquitin-conjugating enzyme E2 O
MAELLLLDSKVKESVSVLELDTGGFGKTNYGVGLGQTVLFCDDNGAPCPEVPSLGQVDPPEDSREGFRQELERVEGTAAAESFGLTLPKGDVSKVGWFGEVVDLHLDGTVSVELFTGEIKSVDIKKLMVLNEPDGPMPMEEFDDGASFQSEKSWETMSQDEQPYSTWEGEENGEMVEEGEFAHITEMNDEDIDMVNGAGSADGDHDDDAMSAADAEAVDHVTEPKSSPVSSVRPLTVTTPGATAPPVTFDSPMTPAAEAGPSTLSARPSLADSEKWARFDILEEAPAEHYYYREPRLQAINKTYHSRLMKEHRALASSLPENILVRTYEDRTDLMRVLIVGPEGTPYADAPFVFDVYLNPTSFPFEPPLVHFHSHTNGLGRCNRELFIVHSQADVSQPLRRRQGVPLRPRYLGWRQIRVMEPAKVVAPSGVCVNLGSCSCSQPLPLRACIRQA